MRQLSENIRRGRLALGITQQQLAERAGISVKYLGKIESSRKIGGVCPSVKVFVALCAALETTPNGLLNHEESVNEGLRRSYSRPVRRDLIDKVMALDDKAAFLVLDLVLHLVKLPPKKSLPRRKNDTGSTGS